MLNLSIWITDAILKQNNCSILKTIAQRVWEAPAWLMKYLFQTQD